MTCAISRMGTVLETVFFKVNHLQLNLIVTKLLMRRKWLRFIRKFVITILLYVHYTVIMARLFINFVMSDNWLYLNSLYRGFIIMFRRFFLA